MIRTTKRSEDERRRAVIPLPATIAAPSQTGKILLSSPTRGISARRTTIAARKIIEVSTSSASKYKLATLVPSRGSRDSKFHSRWTCFRFMNVTPPRVTHERYSVASCFLFYRHVLIYSFLRTCALHGTLRGPLKRKKRKRAINYCVKRGMCMEQLLPSVCYIKFIIQRHGYFIYL